MEEEVEKLAVYFSSRGASPDRARFMSRQLLKRADQISEEEGIPREKALLRLMQRILEAQK